MKIEEIQEEAQEQTSLINGELNISASPSFFMPILLKALANFKKDYPNFRIVMTEKSHQILLKMFPKGRLTLD